MKRMLIALVIAIAAVLGVSAAATAAPNPYNPSGPGDTTRVVGTATQFTFSGFEPNVPATVTVPAGATLTTPPAGGTTDPSGQVTFTVTPNVVGNFSITVSAGGSSASALLTSIPADSNSGGQMATTGFNVSGVVWWLVAGALIIGAALVVFGRGKRKAQHSK